jgi:hypothetical protein
MLKIFNHRFEDTIWSLGYWGTPEQPEIWIETRPSGMHMWYCLDVSTKHLTEMNQAPNQALQWLTGLNDAGVFLKLRQGKNPGIEQLRCYHLPSGELRYEINLTQWTRLDGDYLHTNQGTIDLNTGNYTTQINAAKEAITIESPMHFEESKPEFKSFQTLFEQKFDEKIGKGIDYWEGPDKLIFSYYIYESAWKNKLRICNYTFQTQFIETIAEGDQMGYHTFQHVQNRLIFIKEKHELFIYADH